MTSARPPLRSLDEVLAQLLDAARPCLAPQACRVEEADGCVLAEDLVSELQVPAHDNSSMDGYAVRAGDVRSGDAILEVSQRIPAGAPSLPLRPGTAARIFTGAAVPLGADAVVMQEDCEALAGDATRPERVRVRQAPEPGQWIRRAGEDVTRGVVVLRRGQRLSPAELGLAASLGRDRLQVARAPRVALFSTGDELVMPGTVPPAQMRPGLIYNSNRYFLGALLRRLGCEVSDLGIVPDRLAATQDALRAAALTHDVVLTSGGVSVGEEDHLRPAVQSLGELTFWQMAAKPGKPFAYGRLHRAGPGEHCHYIGLPGNPVSSFVTFLLMVRPFLLRMQGMENVAPVARQLPAHFEWPRADKRREFLRVGLNAHGGLSLFPIQSSGVLTSVAWGDGLVDNPGGQTIAHGDSVRFLAFSDMLA